jgi:hypothetical protein
VFSCLDAVLPLTQLDTITFQAVDSGRLLKIVGSLVATESRRVLVRVFACLPCQLGLAKFDFPQGTGGGTGSGAGAGAGAGARPRSWIFTFGLVYWLCSLCCPGFGCVVKEDLTVWGCPPLKGNRRRHERSLGRRPSEAATPLFLQLPVAQMRRGNRLSPNDGRQVGTGKGPSKSAGGREPAGA